jgi:hypothetical protein
MKLAHLFSSEKSRFINLVDTFIDLIKHESNVDSRGTMGWSVLDVTGNAQLSLPPETNTRLHVYLELYVLIIQGLKNKVTAALVTEWFRTLLGENGISLNCEGTTCFFNFKIEAHTNVRLRDDLDASIEQFYSKNATRQEIFITNAAHPTAWVMNRDRYIRSLRRDSGVVSGGSKHRRKRRKSSSRHQRKLRKISRRRKTRA